MLDAKEESYKGFETFGALPAMLLHPVASYVIQRLIKVRINLRVLVSAQTSAAPKHFK